MAPQRVCVEDKKQLWAGAPRASREELGACEKCVSAAYKYIICFYFMSSLLLLV